MNIQHRFVSTESEFHAFKQAVADARLPHSDLTLQKQVLLSFYDDEQFIGTGGLEIINNVGLLRSVSVRADYRHKSIGRQITNTLLDLARDKKLEEVYLLTETASNFFKKLGFAEVNRTEVPVGIKSTPEFASVCPASANCLMIKF